MKLKYIGGRAFVSVNYLHKRYIFSKENKFICEVPDRTIAAKLVATGQYFPVDNFAETKESVKIQEAKSKVAEEDKKTDEAKIKAEKKAEAKDKKEEEAIEAKAIEDKKKEIAKAKADDKKAVKKKVTKKS